MSFQTASAASSRVVRVSASLRLLSLGCVCLLLPRLGGGSPLTGWSFADRVSGTASGSDVRRILDLFWSVARTKSQRMSCQHAPSSDMDQRFHSFPKRPRETAPPTTPLAFFVPYLFFLVDPQLRFLRPACVCVSCHQASSLWSRKALSGKPLPWTPLQIESHLWRRKGGRSRVPF